MADPLSNLWSSVSQNFNAMTVAYVGLGLAVLIIIVAIAKFFSDKKKFDTLVKIVPMWSVKEQTTQTTAEPNTFQKLMGIKPKAHWNETTQRHNAYFLPAAYVMNNKNGTYEIILKDKKIKKGTVIQGVPYEYFTPINYGQYKRYIEFFRYSPADYKPIMQTIEGHKKVGHVYDSESTYIALKTQEEIRDRYKKGDLWQKYAPWIFMIVILGGLIIQGVLMKQGMEKFAEAVNSNANAILQATKALMVTGK